MGNLLYGTFMRIRESRIILTGEPVLPYCRKPRLRENLEHDRKKAYCGYLSKNAGNTIEKRLQCWFNAIFISNKDNAGKGVVRPYLPVMITCTLSSKQVHDDYYIKKWILQEFLRALQRKKDIKYTFWKAEAQKNGNIHFHILIDKYVDMKFIQGMWNHYQQKHGYLDAYQKEHHTLNAPSTKITGMRSDKSPIGYVLKYVKKGSIKSQNCKRSEAGCKMVVKQLDAIRRPIQGSVFRFSEPLISLTPPAIYCDMDQHARFKELEKEDKFRYVGLDYCQLLYCKKCKSYDLLLPSYKAEIDDFYRDIFYYLYILEGVRPPILTEKPPPPLPGTKEFREMREREKRNQLKISLFSSN